MRLHVPRRWAAVALVALAATGLAGCGGDDDDATESGDTTATTAAEETEEGSAEVTITMKDYAYDVSGPLTAGDTPIVNVINEGTEFHMVAFGRLKDGKELSDVTKVLSEPPPGAQGGESGESGDTSTTTTPAGSSTTAAGGAGGGEEGGDPFEDLFVNADGDGSALLSPGASQKMSIASIGEPGEYALICFLPVEGEGMPHFAKGMVAGLTVVENGPKAEAPTTTAEYTIGKDSFTGPKELKAGKNVIKANTDGQHELVVAKLDAGKTFKDLDDYITKVFESEEEPPAKGTAANSPGEILGAVLGVPEDAPAYLELDLEPGTYVLACVKLDNDDDDDDTNDVAHYKKEQFTVTVK